MAKHRASRPLLRALPAVIALLLVAGVAAGPASASTARLRVVTQDTVDKGNCQFTVTQVDTVHGVVAAKITGNAFPSSLFGYGQIVRNEIVCAVTDGSGTAFLAELDKTNNAATVSGSVSVVIPFYASYQLCGAAGYTTKNGSSGATSAACQTG